MPWKYGFVGLSIVRFSFVAKRPDLLGGATDEYGRANVNSYMHPRWSQANERRIGTEEMILTSALQRLLRGRGRRAPTRDGEGTALHVRVRARGDAASRPCRQNVQRSAFGSPNIHAATRSSPKPARGLGDQLHQIRIAVDQIVGQQRHADAATARLIATGPN